MPLVISSVCPVVIDVQSITSTAANKGHLIFVDDPEATVVITVVVESLSCPSDEPCDSCPSVRWTFSERVEDCSGMEISEGMDYSITDPCTVKTWSQAKILPLLLTSPLAASLQQHQDITVLHSLTQASLVAPGRYWCQFQVIPVSILHT